MAKITVEEVQKLAAISQIELSKDAIAQTAQGIEQVLSYVEMLSTLTPAISDLFSIDTKPNVFRQDIIKGSDAELFLALAPQREESFFVVPVILKN